VADNIAVIASISTPGSLLTKLCYTCTNLLINCSYLFYYGKNVSLPIEVKQKLQSCTDDKNRSLLGMSGNQNGFNSQSWKEVSGSYNWESVQNPELTTDIINS
jgi:hypothetical protein